MYIFLVINWEINYFYSILFYSNIDHNSPQSIASTIISTDLEFQKKSHKFLVAVIPLLPRDHKHSGRWGIINTVNKLLKFQCLNNGFHFLEFKSNWLNNDDSLNIKLFYDDSLHLIRKGNKLLAKETDFFIIWNTWWLIQNLHIRTLFLFHIISQIFHLFLLKASL